MCEGFLGADEKPCDDETHHFPTNDLSNTMYYVYMSFPQMRHCNIAPLHQLGFCHNNDTVDNTFPTCFGGVQVGIQNKWYMNKDTDTDTGCKLDFTDGWFAIGLLLVYTVQYVLDLYIYCM